MNILKKVLVLLAALLVTASAQADTKIVKKVHQDGFSAMGQVQSARDHEQVVWLGESRLRIDQETSSSIVRADLQKLYILNHGRKSYYEIALPVDLDKILPPETARHLMDMMKMTVVVTPSEETRQVGQWNAHRYDMHVSSAMMSMNTIIWASLDTGIDAEKYLAMFGEMIKTQPGMHEVVDQMRSIKGFVVAQEGSMTMPMLGDTEVASSEAILSIEEARAPDGTYDLPAGYGLEEFDFTKTMPGQ